MDDPYLIRPVRGGWRRRLRRLAVALLSAALVVSMFEQPAAAAKPADWSPPAVGDVAGVPTTVFKPDASRLPQPPAAAVRRDPDQIVWPQGSATTDLSTARGAVKATGLPVRIGAPAGDVLRAADPLGPQRVTVDVRDRAATAKAGVAGLLVAASRADGKTAAGLVRVTVDYAGFKDAFGGDWASRLRLYQLPACAATTPQLAGCQTRTPVKSVNDPGAMAVAADVQVSGGAITMLAVEAAASGDNGDYTATSLSAAGTWQVSTQTGDFSWSVPMRMPPALGGPAPSVSLSYSSGSVDGRTSTSNNQGSWIGDGWDSWPGYVERKYASCVDENPTDKTGDQCWFSDNATLSFNGHAGELIRDGSVWRLKNDDGTKIEKLSSAARGNGDNDDEYWKVTTTDGVKYFFGMHKVSGWAAGDPVTDSVWTVPVYGDDAGDPCHDVTWCRQAWRWNLDYVEDPHGNTMMYFYGKETGAYGRHSDPNLRTTFDRGGYLQRIEYGTRSDSQYAQAAPLRVVFDTAERCLSGCWSGAAWTSDPVASAWDDTPWDLYCKAEPCGTQLSPAFFTARRLRKVTTQVRNGTSTYADVESWTLTHEFLNAGNAEGTPMWLKSVARTGHVTTAGGVAVSDPAITFSPGSLPMPNRVDGPSDGRTELNRWRIKAIHTESGGDIVVTYSDTECTKSTLPTPHSNGKRCFPSWYGPQGVEPTLDWFHKYVVTRVDLDDAVTDQATDTTFYDYLDAPAWHYTTDELTKDKHRTWGEWHGYSRVRVRHGDPGNGQQTAVEYRYLRGMDGDKQPTGTRSVTVTDSWGATVTDHEALQGFALQQITFNGPGGAEVSSTQNRPWINGPTATRTRNDITTKAWMTNTETARQRTALEAGGYRYTKTVTSFNSDGMPTAVDNLGDEAKTGDETCARTSYARNTSTWMIDKVSQAETLSVACASATSPAAPSTVLNRSRTFYDAYVDESSFGQAPTKGDVVRAEELERFDAGTPVYTRTATTTYDANGRVDTVTDARGYTTDAEYVTANGGLVTQTKVTGPKGFVTYIDKNPAWGTTARTADPNGAVTDLTYDGLGRLTAVWLPGRAKATQTPSKRFSYLIRDTGGPSAVTTENLLPTGTGYHKSVDLFDGWMRLRQNQTKATGGGRLITETFYNTLGVVEWTSQPYYDSTNTAVGTDLATPSGQIPGIIRREYDGVGRQTAEIMIANGTEKWRTITSHGGDRTHVTPPDGGTATTTITDAAGNTVALRQYKSLSLVKSANPADFDETTYTYTLLNQLKTVTDVTGANTWSYTYDLRGRQASAADPDKGTTTTTYDAAGNVQTVTAPLGTGTATTAYTYDALGRKTSVRDDSVTGTVRAEWVYDTLTNGKGKLTSSTRYSGGDAYTNRINTYDAYGRITSTSLVMPSTRPELCASTSLEPCAYTTTTTYRANGQIAKQTVPQAGDLTSEQFTFGYTDTGAPGAMFSNYAGFPTYVETVTYSKLGLLEQRVLGKNTFNANVAVTSIYDEPTRRLTSTNVVPQAKPEAVNYNYTYDKSGNITKISDTPTGGTADHQCFTLDYLRRLTEAWTPADGTCTTPTAWSSIGGPAPYWHTWALAPNGNRQTETRHGSTNTTYTYTYPAAGQPRPHTVTNIAASGAATWSRDYTYDNAGNTKTRPTGNGDTQTLTWDREGHQLTSSDTGGNTGYIYDADGNRLVRTDPAGKTLYLPDGTELRYTTSGATKTATRYYTHAGQTIGVRTSAGLHWIISDHNGTAELTIDAATLAVAKRRNLPYGEERGTITGPWAPGYDKGFLGKTNDPTGLTHVGAREYDPFIGRFVSVDPVMDLGDPQQWQGYAYANGSPVTFTDPDGLEPRPWHDKNHQGAGGPPDPYYSSTIYGTGTRLTVFSGGTADINGFPLPTKGAPDPKWLAQQVDKAVAKGVDDRSEVGTYRLIAMVCEANLDVCSYEFMLAARELYLIAGMPDENDVWAQMVMALATDGQGSTAMYKLGRELFGNRSAANRYLGKKGYGCGNSFTADTQVLLEDGTSRPISEIAIGDKVVATDPESGLSTPMEVTRVHLNHDLTLTDLTVVDEQTGTTFTVHTTWEHPFWVENGKKWVNASELLAGDTLKTYDEGRVSIVAVENRIGQEWMYNLTVENIHTYYVLAGNTPVLVHNDGGGYTTPGNNSYLTVDEALDAGLKWLGEGYTEPVPGSGRYVSRDGTRVFRMGDSDILGKHGGGPHTNFERMEVDPKTGRMKVVQNDHVYFKGGTC